MIKEKKIQKIIRARSVGVFKNLCGNFLKILYPYIEKHIPKKEEYCPEVQEIYRFFEILIEKEQGDSLKKKWKIIRDMVCFGLEYDRPYLLRFLDAFQEIDISKFKLTTPEKYLKGLGYDFKPEKKSLINRIKEKL